MIYFDISDFDSKDEPGSGQKYMNRQLLYMIDQARGLAGVPFIPSSGYRSVAQNKKAGGKRTSSHRKGLAVDIVCTHGPTRIKIVKALIEVGFTRIGIAGSFIHVDNDSSKIDSIWLYF